MRPGVASIHSVGTAAALAAAVFALVVPFSVARAEDVQRMRVLIDIDSNGSAKITETIDYNFGDTPRHGIYRDLPFEIRSEEGTSKLEVTELSARTADGTEYDVDEFAQRGKLRIRIGDPNVEVTGVHTYVISYRATPVISFFEGYDELYWNAIGAGWPVPIAGASVEVVLPSPVAAGSLQFACYLGAEGSTAKCPGIPETNADGLISRVRFDSPSTLAPMEGMTVAVGFPKGMVTEPKTLPLKDTLRYLLFALVPLIAFFMVFRRWQAKGKDAPASPVIIPEYEPPKGFTPIEVSAIYRGAARKEDIAAEIIYLAVRGHLRIEHEGGAYRLVLQKPADESLSVLGKDLLSAIEEEAEEEDTRKVLTITKSYAPAFAKTVADIISDASEMLEREGFFRANPREVMGVWSIAGVCTAVAAFIAWGAFESPLAGLSLFAVAAIFFGGAYVMPARTKKGAAMKDYIEGFKEYLTIAEKDRLKFHNPPERTTEQFEALLPFALVLGVEKSWAKEFEDLYHTEPNWYRGDGTFSSSSMVSALNSFAATSSHAATAPSSSGSGGGGSVGGGGGGGGGGSW